jgi:protein-tyrosine kinase
LRTINLSIELKEGFMKITKAMQKVKDQQMPVHVNRVQRQYCQIQPAGGAEGDWVPPVYWNSQSCEPDLISLEKNRCVCFREDAPELDYYKMLRTQIMQRTKAKGWNTVMITSALPGEGKTVTSINLAMAFAKAYNQTALLVDSDLRQQKVYYYMGIDSRLGIFDHIVEGRPLKDIIIWPRIEKMTLISGGRIINESAELLGSPKMKSLIEEMKTRYNDRYILFDAPPVLSGADALILSSLVDGIVMVVEANKTSLKDIQEALTLMPKEKFLGFVLNKHTSERQGYYYYNARSAKERSKRR